VTHTGGGLERRPESLPSRPSEKAAERSPETLPERRTEGVLERLPAPYRTERDGDVANIIGWPELAAWARDHSVVLFGLVLIAAQLVWRSIFLGHYFFWQDDFHFMELGLGHSFTWSYLSTVAVGHWFPGVYAIFWVVARAALYNWAFASAITVLLLAAADLAALRLLRTLFGDRPAILVPLLIYLLCPLSVMDIRFWSAAIELWPLEIAIFMALTSQVHYVRTGRFRHAVAVAAWLAFGLIFNEKALVLPLLLFAITSAFLIEGPWKRTIGRCLVKYWRSWLLQAVMLACYAAVFASSLHTSSVQPSVPGTATGVFSFTEELVKDTFVPGAIGGPWQWSGITDAQIASAATPNALAWLSVIVAVAVILASMMSRRYAWRGWAILAGWLLAADVGPVVIGRIGEMSPGVLAQQTRYVADAVPVLAICVGLAFLPLAGQPDTRRRMAVPDLSQAARLAAAGLVGAFTIGSVWSVQDLQNTTSGRLSQIYIENAEAAVAQAPTGTVIADWPVPSAVMIGAFGQSDRASEVIGPTESAVAKTNIRWTAHPDGTIDHLMMFGPDGRLHQTAMYGPVSVPLSAGRRCQRVRHGMAVVRFTSPTFSGANELRIAYIAAANGDEMTVSYGGSAQVLTLQAGLHVAYLPEQGSVDSVTVSGAAMGGLCIGDMQAGTIVPSNSGPVIPATY
jgi:hypothetical protein